MTDPNLRKTLERKAMEIEARLEEYRRHSAELQNDLVHLRGTISLFEQENVRASSPYVSLTGVFKRGEIFAICQTALADNPKGLDTRELAERCMRSKKLDPDDKLLRRSMMQSIAQMMQVRRKSGQVSSAEKRGLTCVWALLLR